MRMKLEIKAFLNLHETINFFNNVTYFAIISRKNVIVFHSQMVMSEKPVQYTIIAAAAGAVVGLLLLLQLVAPSLES